MTTLANGLRVLTDTMPGVESVAFGVWADAGSSDEGRGEFGQTHLLEHMLFKGTQSQSAFELAEAIEDIGGQMNAFTERETTHFFCRVLAEHLPEAINIMGDMICRSVFPEEEMARELQVVIEEIRKYESLPDELIHDLIMEGLWQNGALGHPILGTEENVRGLTRNHLLTCWNRHFAANRVLVTAAGKLDHDELVALVDKAFADLPPASADWPRLPEGNRVPHIIVEKDEEQVNFCWGGRTYPVHDDRNFPLAMVDAIFGSSTTSRLFQEVREKRGLAYDVGSYTMGFRETGLLCANAATSPETFPQVVSLMRQEVEKLRREGITAKELTRAKEQMKAGMALSSESTVERMRILATHLMTWGAVYPISYLIEKMNQVTLDDIHRVIDETLNLDDWTFTAIGPIEQDKVKELISR